MSIVHDSFLPQILTVDIPAAITATVQNGDFQWGDLAPSAMTALATAIIVFGANWLTRKSIEASNTKAFDEMKVLIKQNKEIEERKMVVANHKDWLRHLVTEFSTFCASCESICDDVHRTESYKKMVSEGRTEWVRKEFLKKMDSKRDIINEALNGLHLNIFKIECLLDSKNALHMKLLEEIFTQKKELDKLFQLAADGELSDELGRVSKDLVESMRAVREEANKRAKFSDGSENTSPS